VRLHVRFKDLAFLFFSFDFRGVERPALHFFWGSSWVKRRNLWRGRLHGHAMNAAPRIREFDLTQRPRSWNSERNPTQERAHRLSSEPIGNAARCRASSLWDGKGREGPPSFREDISGAQRKPAGGRRPRKTGPN
jgi:hypothetical protein